MASEVVMFAVEEAVSPAQPAIDLNASHPSALCYSAALVALP